MEALCYNRKKLHKKQETNKANKLILIIEKEDEQ